MSDNKLLAENTIRRFMQLANTEALANNFIAENKAEELEEEVEETNEEINEEEEVELEENLEDLEEQEEEEEMEIDAELGGEPEAADEPMDAAPEMGEADMSLTEEEAELLISLGERLKAAMGGEAPADEEPADDMEPADDVEPEAPEAGEEEDAPGYAINEEDQEELVNEVLKRVTKRLVAAKLNRK